MIEELSQTPYTFQIRRMPDNKQLYAIIGTDFEGEPMQVVQSNLQWDYAVEHCDKLNEKIRQSEPTQKETE